jgi:hypothetical protein
MYKEEQMTEVEKKEVEYKQYIDAHIYNVQKVWEGIKPSLCGEYWIDDYTYHQIDANIQLHDQSKYSIDEFNGYRQWFYPVVGEAQSIELYDKAWNHHIHNNLHHWNYWVVASVYGNKALKMPCHYIFEMLCDWTAMSLKFKDVPSEFYRTQKNTMILHKETEIVIKNWLPIFDEFILDRGEK